MSNDLPPNKVTRSRNTLDDSKRFAKELSTLNYGLAVRDREVAARATNRGVGEDDVKKRNITTFKNFQAMLESVDDEINVTLMKTSWKRLAHKYKTRFVKEYVTNNSLLDESDKDTLIKCIDELTDVDYNMKEMRIEKLNYTYNGVSL